MAAQDSPPYSIFTRTFLFQLEKYQNGDFGHCCRVYCENQAVLPIGKLKKVKKITDVQ